MYLTSSEVRPLASAFAVQVGRAAGIAVAVAVVGAGLAFKPRPPFGPLAVAVAYNAVSRLMSLLLQPS